MCYVLKELPSQDWSGVGLASFLLASMQQIHCSEIVRTQLKGSVKELNKFHNYETEKITRKASNVAEYIEFYGSSARNRHARRI